MNEQGVYDLMITHSDPKERHFFEEHGNESLHLAKKAQHNGVTDGVMRYRKNGKYIDLAPDGSIISFGKN